MNDNITDIKTIRKKALNLLARREHSLLELRNKLKKYDFDSDAIEKVLSELQQENLQSDARFAENFIAARINRGYGPAHIKQELKYRQVNPALIEKYLFHGAVDWSTLAEKVRIKKFGKDKPKDFEAKAKQMRFLQYRGFSMDCFNDF